MQEKPEADRDAPKKGADGLGLFGTLLQFYQRTVRLVRRSSLDVDAKVRIYERIHSQMEELSDEIKNDVVDPRDFDLAGRLESIYNEAKAAIEEAGGAVQPEEPNGEGV